MGISSVTGTWEIGDNWPYPKIFITDYLILAIAKASTDLKLYELTNSANTWTATEKATLGTLVDIINVDVAGFGTYCIVTVNLGATKTVFERDSSDGTWGSVNVTTIPGGSSMCNFNGQLIIGSPYSTGAPWKDLPKCSIAWGDIGSNKMNPEDDVVAGFRQMPFDENGNNAVQKVLPLGDRCMIYGDAGVSTGKMTMVDKYPAMSFIELSRVGVSHNYLVAGDIRKHIYLGKNNEIMLATSEGVKSLGYKKIMKELTVADIVITHEPVRDKFFISDGVKCFVLAPGGMYSTHQCTTGITDYKGIQCGFVKDNGDTKIRLQTTGFDLGIQGYKTVESVESGLDYGLSITGTVLAKYEHGGDFISAPGVTLNSKGMFTSKITGREFKIQLEGNYDSLETFQLSSILCKLKFGDKTNTRGRLNVG